MRLAAVAFHARSLDAEAAVDAASALEDRLDAPTSVEINPFGTWMGPVELAQRIRRFVESTEERNDACQ
jgi:hypothetical protein